MQEIEKLKENLKRLEELTDKLSFLLKEIEVVTKGK